MHGFINIHKPPGLTSFDVIRQLKKKLPRRSKLGHLGTLDPMAEGVLPVAAGNATRLIKYIEDDNKEYIGSGILGATSDTQDAWGNITYTKEITSVQQQVLQQVLKQFTGVIWQIPPMYSAVHHQGQRLYELARQGMEVERKPRQITIEDIELLGIDYTGNLPEITLKIKCSKGTYIRTLIHDIGQSLGTGAYLSSLVRTRAGVFQLQEAVALQEIMEAADVTEHLLPEDYPLMHIAAYALSPEKALHIKQGRSIKCEEFTENKMVRLYLHHELVAIARYEAEFGILKPETVLT